MDARELRGLEIAAKSNIELDGATWSVPSQSGKGRYYVEVDGDESTCTCPDHEVRNVKCKHIHAVEFVRQRRDNADGTTTVTETVQFTETVSRTYPQDWPAYNAAQTNEKAQFQTLLRDLCKTIPEPPCNGRGRPAIPRSDSTFGVCFKVYSTVSGRRFMTDLREAHAKGYLSHTPSYNSLFRAFESDETTAILQHLITESALPLKAVESSFACDSSGFSTSRFDRWYDVRCGVARMKRTWVKTHLMCGVKTNVVTAVEIQGPSTADAPVLPSLVNRTAQNFDLAEVSADMGYSSARNIETIHGHGATPYIPFKRNASGAAGGLWEKAFHYYSLNREEFLQRYHLRSNVESTFAMIKAKFGDSVRSKTDTAMKNEVLAKVLCHNICCLIQSAYEFGVKIFFEAKEASASEIGGFRDF